MHWSGLTSRHTKETDARNISSYWVDFWKQNEDDLRAKDAELRGKRRRTCASRRFAARLLR